MPSPRAEPVAAGPAAEPQLRPEASAWRALDAAAPTDAAEPKQGNPVGDEALPAPPEQESPASARSRDASASSS